MNFNLLWWEHTDYFKVTVVRDTHGLKIFEVYVYTKTSVKLRQLDGLSAYHFIPLFIVDQNPPFVWRKISCTVHQSNLKTTRRTVVRDMWYGTFCPNAKNELFRVKTCKFIHEMALILKEKHFLDAFMNILSDFSLILFLISPWVGRKTRKLCNAGVWRSILFITSKRKVKTAARRSAINLLDANETPITPFVCHEERQS